MIVKLRNFRLFFASVIFGCAACAPFHPRRDADLGVAATETQPATPTVDVSGIKKHMFVSAEGEFAGDEFKAERIEIKDPDKEIEVKSEVRSVDLATATITIGSVELTVVADTKIVDASGKDLTLAELSIGDWIKAESVFRDGVMQLRKLTKRVRKDGELEKLAGEIDDVEAKQRTMTIGTASLEWKKDARAAWDSEAPIPAELTQEFVRAASQHPALERVRRIDSDNLRPDKQLHLGDDFTVGGEVRYELEWRDNYDLRDDLERDRLVHEISATLELSAVISDKAAFFGSVRGGKEYVIVDQTPNLDLDSRFALNEGYIVVDDIFVDGFSVQVGRQDFDQGREWIYDHNLDALRLYFRTDFDVTFEASISTVLWDADPEDKKVVNYVFGATAEPIEDQVLFFWFMHRHNGQLIDFDRNHVGVSGNGKIDAFEWWLDAGFSWGKEFDKRDGSILQGFELDVAGYGVDFSAMYVFEEEFWEPSVFAGVAYGSGDGDPYDGSDGNFRQTGINDNQDQFNGITSFRYLGELTRFDLSNIVVTTVGFGIRPFSRTSVDFLHHHYWQDEKSALIGPTRLRMSPTGQDSDLGDEFDVVIGFKYFSPFEVKLIGGYFHPGEAFRQGSGDDADDAWYVFLQLKMNF